MTGYRVALISMCALLTVHSGSGRAESLECQLLREEIINYVKSSRENRCDRDYQTCMAVSDQIGRAYCGPQRNACEAGRGLAQALSNKQERLKEMIEVYKTNCE
jgi:hypothetical protein